MSIISKISSSQLISATVTKQEVLSIKDMKIGDSLTPNSVETSLNLIKLLSFWQNKGEQSKDFKSQRWERLIFDL